MDNILAERNRIRNSSDANDMVEGINSFLSETAVDCNIKKKKKTITLVVLRGTTEIVKIGRKT